MILVRSAVPWLALLLIASCSRPPRPSPSLDDLGAVGPFRLVERNGGPVGPADLAGKVWVASFVFTRCTGPCPQVTGTVARLQEEIGPRPDFRLVTFTVDPDHDRPEELKEYAEHFRADPERWLFLTGPTDEVHRIIREDFHLGVEPTQGQARTPGNEVVHSTKLALVDRSGHIRGYFDGRQVDDEGRQVEDLPRLTRAIQALLGETP